MAHLYKFTCQPNYPVITEAVLIVYTDKRLTNMGHVLASIASEQGFTWAHGNSKSDYIGEITLSGVAEMYPDGVVTCITGEY